MPDTKKIGWHVPYMDQWGRLPLYDQTLAGIAVGPTVEMGGFTCSPDRPSSLLAITPRFLPEGVVREEEHGSDVCAQGVMNDISYYRPWNEDDLQRLNREEIGFFEARGGGYFHVFKRFMTVPAWQMSFPGEKLRAGTINGYPAVIGEPMFAEGFGDSLIIIYQPNVQVLTVIGGVQISSEELFSIAEGLVP